MTAAFDEHGIYLQDHEKGVLHNLKEGPYIFNISGGVIEDERFVLRFLEQEDQDLSLGEGEETPEDPDRIIWSIQNEVLNVRTRSNTEILDLKLYDMLGRTVLSSQPRNKTVRIPGLSIAYNAIYFLQVSTKNREVLTTRILHL